MELRIVLWITILLKGIAMVESDVSFTLFTDDSLWDTAQANCEALGQRLAALDTAEKQSKLETQLSIPASEYPWIGIKDVGDNDVFVWTNGAEVEAGYTNWDDGNPDHGDNDCGYMKDDYSWADYECDDDQWYICEWNECEAGHYKTGSPPSCVMCTGNTVKSTVGDATSCPTVCDGTTKVPNSGHTECVCNVGHFKNGNDCELCTGNTIKSTIGDAADCNVDAACDGTTNIPNAAHTACICNSGYYRNGSSCVLCPGNEIKSTPGDAADCSADPPCDSATGSPASNRTYCGDIKNKMRSQMYYSEMYWIHLDWHIRMYYYTGR